MSAPSIKLTYFNIEGAAEKVRLAFVLNGVNFEDNRIGFDAWQSLKPTTKFGQLPLMEIDGAAPIAQSDAMMRYADCLGTKATAATDAAQTLRVNETLGLLGDMNRAWAPCLYMSMSPQTYGYPEGWGKTEEGQAKIK